MLVLLETAELRMLSFQKWKSKCLCLKMLRLWSFVGQHRKLLHREAELHKIYFEKTNVG